MAGGSHHKFYITLKFADKNEFIDTVPNHIKTMHHIRLHTHTYTQIHKTKYSEHRL